MVLGINKTDSTPKTVVKAGVLGAAAGTAAKAAQSLKPTAKQAYDAYIAGQQAVIDEIKAKPNVGKYFENIYKMIEKVTSKGAEGVNETMNSFKKAGNTKGANQMKGIVEKLFTKGKDATIEEIREAEKSFGRNLENPLPSKITAVKKSAKAVCDKVLDKAAKAAEAAKSLKNSPNKINWLKDNSGKIKEAVKKYGPAALIAAGATITTALVVKAIKNHKAAKEAE